MFYLLMPLFFQYTSVCLLINSHTFYIEICPAIEVKSRKKSYLNLLKLNYLYRYLQRDFYFLKCERLILICSYS